MDCLFLINPVSGGMEGQGLTDTLNRDFNGLGHNIHAVLINRNNPMAQLKSLVSGKELVVIAGGDGTVSQLATCLSMLDAPPPFAILPMGTGNDLARSTGWFRIWKHGKLDAFFAALSLSRVESLDVWGFDSGPRFVCYSGIGLDARIISSIDRHRTSIPGITKWQAGTRYMMKILYCAAAVKHVLSELIHGRPQQGTIRFYRRGKEVKSVKCDRTEVLIMASIDSYAGGGHLSESASRSDGIFEVYCFPFLYSYINFIIKSRVGKKFTPQPSFLADRAEFVTGTSVALQLDGEPASIPHSHGTQTVSLQRVIPILIPPDDLAAREKIRRKSIADTRIKGEIIIPGAAAGKNI